MDNGARVYVAGHRGMVGSAIVRRLKSAGYGNLIVAERAELDLTNQHAVDDFFRKNKPDHVFLAAARVGGIAANDALRGQFIRDNLLIQTNVIHGAYTSGVKRLLFLGSTCIYPKFAPQPMQEEHLLTGPLEPTNDAYAVAKIAGITMCRSYNNQYGTRFLSVMPNNLYGSNDNFDLTTSHVLPALMRKFHEAKLASSPQVEIWGSGTPLREFLHVDDLADACLFLMALDDAAYCSLLQDPAAPGLVNVGSGQEVSILDLALLIKEIVGYGGELVLDASRPDGTPRKLADSSRIHGLGWQHRVDLQTGLSETYRWFQEQYEGKAA